MQDRNTTERDILKELGNIGAGNALTSLSTMLGRPLTLGLPACRLVERAQAGSLLQDPTSLYAGVSMSVRGTLDCMLVLLMNKPFAEMVAGTLDASEASLDVGSLTDMQKSALCEVGNIMGNSYLTALASILDLQANISVPRIVVDKGERVLQEFLEGYEKSFDRLLFINSAFTTEDTTLESCMLLCPSDDSLSLVLNKLNG